MILRVGTIPWIVLFRLILDGQTINRIQRPDCALAGKNIGNNNSLNLLDYISALEEALGKEAKKILTDPAWSVRDT